jgi:acyl carrier protein
MQENEVYDKVKEVISDVLKIDVADIKPETRFVEDLKADSMDQFFLVDGLCEKFNINITDEDARKIHSVEDAVKAVSEVLKS